MGGFASNTSYLPGGTVQTSSSGPGIGGVGMIDPRWLERMAQFKLDREDEDKKYERGQQRMDRETEAARYADAQRMQQRAMAAQEEDKLRARSAAAQDRGEPVFVKTVSGPGMIPGTIRLNQWEPGAAFAGYTDTLGKGPASASIQAPGDSAASFVGAPPPPAKPPGHGSGTGSGNPINDSLMVDAIKRADGVEQQKAMTDPPDGYAGPPPPPATEGSAGLFGGVTGGGSSTAPAVESNGIFGAPGTPQSHTVVGPGGILVPKPTPQGSGAYRPASYGYGVR